MRVKKLIALALSLVMTFSLAMPAYAAEGADYTDAEVETIEIETVEVDMIEMDMIGAAAAIQLCDSTDADIVDLIREAMVNRESSVTFSYSALKGWDLGGKLREWLGAAFAVTSNPKEGDYLEKHLAKYSCGATGKGYPGGIYNYEITLTLEYYTNAQQEAEVDQLVEGLIQELNLKDDSISDYAKVKAIYDWMCGNIRYDYDSLNNPKDNSHYSAYAALAKKTCVCQGYASLLYRLLKEAGINTRIITGIGNGGAHAWNIIELKNKYYLADATWDAIYKQAGYEYMFFLKGSSDFEDHFENTEFMTDEFRQVYPISVDNYMMPCRQHKMVYYPMNAATCINNGNYEYYQCTKCSNMYWDESGKQEITQNAHIILPTGKHELEWVIDCEPIETTAGLKHEECKHCGFKQNEETKFNHTFGAWVEIKAPTAGEKGIARRSCTSCGKTETKELYYCGWYQLNSKWYYRDANGQVLVGRHEIDNVAYFFRPDGSMVTGWYLQDGQWYYCNGSGELQTGWFKAGSVWYYGKENGAMATGKQMIGGVTYFFNLSGSQKTGWIQDEGTWYYYTANGDAKTGWFNVAGTYYYANTDGSLMVSEWLDDIYYLSSSGAMVTGWQNIGGKYYYFNSSGAKSSNTWSGSCWLGSDGVMATNAWVDGGKYHVDGNGIYQTGWLKLEDSWYYLGTSGMLQKGWFSDGGIWYYGDSTGKLLEEEWLDNNYFFKKGGAMATGWQMVGEDYYYFYSSGSKAAGTWIGNYYLKADGVMATSEWVDNERYYVDENGVWNPNAVK